MNSPEFSAPSGLTGLVDAALAESGLSIRGFVAPRPLRAALDPLPEAIRSRYGADLARGAAVVALPYGEGPAQPPEWARAWLAERPGPLATLARFARANWYGELIRRLKKAAALGRNRMKEGGLDVAAAGAGGVDEGWRCLANSRLPEKRLALAAGLGSLGRHGLVMVRGAGPACVLGLLLLPFETELEGQSSPRRLPSRCGGTVPRGAADGRDPADRPLLGEDCGACRACIEACPTGALSEAGFERLRCIQHWTAVSGALPPAIEAAWGDRLYGCEACLEACPRYRPDPEARSDLGLLGPGLPASWLLEAQEGEIKARLRGSALGLGWMSIDAFRRNAALALRCRARVSEDDGFDASVRGT